MKKLSIFIFLMLIASIAMASPPSRTYTYNSGDVIDPAKVTTNEDNIYNYLSTGVDTYADGTIVNADISTTAAIADSKLDQITTASKVSGTALTGLASIVSGAGEIPVANIPTINLTNKVTGALPIANGGTNATDAATAKSNLGAASFAISGTVVQTGNGPGQTWTDLDLSAVVGTNSAIVFLRVYNVEQDQYIGFRTNGVGGAWASGDDTTLGASVVHGYAGASAGVMAVVVTDTSGVVEWFNEAANQAASIQVVAYIK